MDGTCGAGDNDCFCFWERSQSNGILSADLKGCVCWGGVERDCLEKGRAREQLVNNVN